MLIVTRHRLRFMAVSSRESIGSLRVKRRTLSVSSNHHRLVDCRCRVWTFLNEWKKAPGEGSNPASGSPGSPDVTETACPLTAVQGTRSVLFSSRVSGAQYVSFNFVPIAL